MFRKGFKVEKKCEKFHRGGRGVDFSHYFLNVKGSNLSRNAIKNSKICHPTHQKKIKLYFSTLAGDCGGRLDFPYFFVLNPSPNIVYQFYSAHDKDNAGPVPLHYITFHRQRSEVASDLIFSGRAGPTL